MVPCRVPVVRVARPVGGCSSSKSRGGRAAPSRTGVASRRRTIRAEAEDGGSVDPDTISALNNRILIRPDQIQEKTAGGILLPGSATTVGGTFGIGEIVSIEDTVSKDMNIKKGTKVCYPSFSGTKVNVGEELIFINAKDVLATVD